MFKGWFEAQFFLGMIYYWGYHVTVFLANLYKKKLQFIVQWICQQKCWIYRSPGAGREGQCAVVLF